MKTISFDGKILILGCGGVSQCTIPLLLAHLKMPAERITVVDMLDNRATIADALAKGVRYVQEEITRADFPRQFARFVGRGDMIVDLSWNLHSASLIDWCHENGVRYVNTSVEVWDPYENLETKQTTERTLYHRQMELRRMIARWGGNGGPTCVVDHGANPGLVSHFTKMALLDIGRKIVADKPNDPRRAALEDAIASQAFNKLAQLAGVKVIHISERDTQITNRPKEVDEFVNTWSIEGFFEEGTAPTEMGWELTSANFRPARGSTTPGRETRFASPRRASTLGSARGFRAARSSAW